MAHPIKQLVGQTAIYGLSSIVGRLLYYFLTPLITRAFLPDEYGVVTELYAYVGFLLVFLTYGMETGFFRFAEKSKNPQLVFSTSQPSAMPVLESMPVSRTGRNRLTQSVEAPNTFTFM